MATDVLMRYVINSNVLPCFSRILRREPLPDSVLHKIRQVQERMRAYPNDSLSYIRELLDTEPDVRFLLSKDAMFYYRKDPNRTHYEEILSKDVVSNRRYPDRYGTLPEYQWDQWYCPRNVTVEMLQRWRIVAFSFRDEPMVGAIDEVLKGHMDLQNFIARLVKLRHSVMLLN